MVKKVLLDNRDCLESGLRRILDAFLVVWVTTNERAEPTTKGRKNLLVEEGHPFQDGSVANKLVSFNGLDIT